jgi:hypothetical protein
VQLFCSDLHWGVRASWLLQPTNVVHRGPARYVSVEQAIIQGTSKPHNVQAGRTSQRLGMPAPLHAAWRWRGSLYMLRSISFPPRSALHCSFTATATLLHKPLLPWPPNPAIWLLHVSGPLQILQPYATSAGRSTTQRVSDGHGSIGLPSDG